MARPLVSIVIPCYNAESYVGSAIESALAQTHDPTEVIVVDDGSTDGSLGVIRSFDDQITCVSTPNRGACHARNEGLRRASGTYVKFLDADDVLFRGAVRSQVGTLIDIDDSYVSVFGYGLMIEHDGSPIEIKSYRTPRSREDPVEYILNVNPQTSLPLHRRDRVVDVGGFDQDLHRGQEYDLHLRLTLSGVKFLYQLQPISSVRWHQGESKISNQDHMGERTYEMLRWVQTRAEMIEDAGMLTDRVRQRLARSAWRWGRQALRRGFGDAAHAYFQCAYDLHSDPITGVSTAYVWTTWLFGPRFAERVGAWTHNLRRSLGVG